MEIEPLLPPELVPEIFYGIYIIIILLLLLALGFFYIKYRNLKKAQRNKPYEPVVNERPRLTNPTPPVVRELAIVDKPGDKPSTSILSNSLAAKSNEDKLAQYINEVITESAEQYGTTLTFPWVYKSDVWVELVFCLLDQFYEPDKPKNTRDAVTMLRYLNLLDIKKLAAITSVSDPNAIVINSVLKQHGFSESEAQIGIKLITRAAKNIHDEYNGNVHNIILPSVINIRNQLIKKYYDGSLNSERLSIAITYWLQGIFNIPIASEDRAVKAFCAKYNMTPDDLQKAADKLDLNITFVEKVLEQGQILNHIKKAEKQA